MATINEIFSIGKSGLNASRALLSVAGFNISNAHTPGYNRELLPLSPEGVAGFGVAVGNPQSVRNPFLARSLVTTFGRLGYHEGKLEALGQVQETINELDDIGLLTSIDIFQNSLLEMAANPAGSAERQAVLGAGQALSSQFASIRDQIESALKSTAQQAEILGDQITFRAQQILSLNAKIRSFASTGQNPEALVDKRDAIITELGRDIDIQVIPQTDGTVRLFVAGGRPLVSAESVSAIRVNLTGGGSTYSLSVTIEKANGTQLVPVKELGGVLGGLVDVQNDVLAPSIDKIDQMAYFLGAPVGAPGIAGGFNGVHAVGFASDGATTGLDFFQTSVNLAPGADPWDGAAANLQLAPGVDAQPENILAALVAAQAPGANDNLLNMSASIDQLGTLPSGESLREGFENVTIQVAETTNRAELGRRTETSSATQISNLLLSETGVSVDEEMINMTQANQAFNAASMLIRQADEMARTLISMVG